MQAENTKISQVSERLESLRTALGLNKTKFAEKLGLTGRNYSDMIGMKAVRPSAEVMEAAVKLGANAHWLLTGEGAMRAGPDEPLSPIEATFAGFLMFPLYDVSAAAGPERDVLTETKLTLMAFREEWIRGELRANPADLFLITVEGDSMTPTLADGQVLLIDKSRRQVADAGIYLVRYYDGLMVKRVERHAGELRLISDNPAYGPKVVRPDEMEIGVSIRGRVVWGGRRY
jgi:phage repressor protein C with HTH and peptisase S24 domain